jgi:CHAT domain-containing protein/Tfp pilus assembly protein PilF
MLASCLALALSVGGIQSAAPSAPYTDSISPYISRASTDSALGVIAARQPDSLRNAISAARARAVHARAEKERLEEQSFAARLASAYADAWTDSFFLHEVDRFAAASSEWRRRWVTADSTRRMGVMVSSSAGVPSAMRLWRRGAVEFRALHDTAGIAASEGNLGAGYYLEGALDSAVVFLERARRLALLVGDIRTEANAVGTLGSVYKDRGELREAYDLYTRALALRVRSGDGRGAASDRNNLGLIAQSLGTLDEARHDFSAALEDNRAAGRLHPAAINLTNLASLATLIGNSPSADSLYAAALAIHRQLGERDDEAVVLHDIALLQMRQADYDRALQSLTRALSLSDSTGATLEHLTELTDLASLQMARGDVEAALTTIRGAQRDAHAAHAPAELLARLSMTHGDVAVSLNTVADAEHDYALAGRLASKVGERALEAEAELGRGLLLVQRAKYEAAATVLTASVRNHEGTGDAREAAASRIALGYAQAMGGDTARARGTLGVALRRMKSVNDAAGIAAAFAAIGDLDVREGSTLSAESAYRMGIAALGVRPVPNVAWNLHASLGSVLRSRGAMAEASAELRAAISYVEHTASALTVSEQRESFRADKWEAYATLAFIEQQRRQPAEAFAVSEQLRARQALELLGRGTVHYIVQEDSSIARRQLLRHRIDELTRLVAGDDQTPSAERGTADAGPARDAARDALAQLEHEYAALDVATGKHDDDMVRDANARPVSAHDVMSALEPDEVLLEYLITDSASTVFVLTSDTTVAIDLDVRRHELASLVDFARDAIARPAAGGATAWRAPLRRLYQLLVQPAEDAGFLRGKKRMVVIPHAELHFVPFSALITRQAGDHFLVEQSSILTAPSASMWLRLTRSHRVQSGYGVLALAPRADVLPASRREVESIERLYESQSAILQGGAATREAFVKAAPSSDIIHLASLGVLNKQNPLFSFVELAPHGADAGRLAVTDVLALRLDARLVTLSACQTALGSGARADVPAGDDWVGFTSAFLRAGARDVLASLWPVEDEATATLMTSFYGNFHSGANAADALAEAQRAAIRDPSRSAPFRWAGFVMTGAR